MTLGQIIKQIRVEKALSQPELAEKIGIEQSYLSKLENDKSLPSNEMLQAILL
ncbi:XRE family transcriptional regulator [Parashewanella spongiae]|uniref:XRE family transcriptional regulator n=1 Tax=Parashewanella spongiae TaxID=342950 RepID=A0A3A6TVX6_9GAMM|nr:helix-turn-helix transcriptional regulator [Parashewanella spongiae]MCL1076679.1 helix-turn-helix domain-containing protein [Parashewanella spongiae]RJY18487.1 XRE family transcriptional regulator [Parashewanella spongiae]